MMNSPEFLQQMSSMMSNPAIFEQALALNPQLSSIGPQAREMFQSERFRQMMSVFISVIQDYIRLTAAI
jgi:ubiquilin